MKEEFTDHEMLSMSRDVLMLHWSSLSNRQQRMIIDKDKESMMYYRE